MSLPPPEGRASAANGVRLQKVLASAGLGSRRACEELIAAGRVRVNGTVATLGTRVGPQDAVQVDGARVPTGADQVYLALNKPVGMVSAMRDGTGRPCVGDVVADRGPGLHHVGRLDVDSEGLLLITNDGELAHRLIHPSYRVPKRYLVEIEGIAPRSLGRTLRAGIELEDGPAAVDEFSVVDSTPGRSLVEVVIHEGRNRIVRRMFETAGHPVRRLVRTAIGPIRLGELRSGRLRVMSTPEVQSLYRLVDL